MGFEEALRTALIRYIINAGGNPPESQQVCGSPNSPPRPPSRQQEGVSPDDGNTQGQVGCWMLVDDGVVEVTLF